MLYYFHLAQGFALRVKPFLDEQQRGLFATRAPARPNPIGLSTVRLERVEGTRLYIREVDIVDGTPPAGHQALRAPVRPTGTGPPAAG